eukprot:1157298-Pelagomonas_calceolata.AAC.15
MYISFLAGIIAEKIAMYMANSCGVGQPTYTLQRELKRPDACCRPKQQCNNAGQSTSNEAA